MECAKSTGPGNDLPAGSQNKVRLSASKDVEEDDLRDCAEKVYL